MKFALLLVTGTCLICCAACFGQDNASSGRADSRASATGADEKEPGRQKSEGERGVIDVLSDTNGVDLHSYVHRLMLKVRSSWYALVPESAKAPTMRRGRVTIEFRVIKDGQISNLRYAESSGDPELDQAAYGGIKNASPFPLPDDFACGFLALRFHFYYNPLAGDIEGPLKGTEAPLVPCVTTKIRWGEVVGIGVSPTSVQVGTGANQQFSVSLASGVKSPVAWSLEGPACVGSACGVISPEGLYTAPLTIPHPANVTVRATPDISPGETAASTIIVVQR
jgi:TonB family protein